MTTISAQTILRSRHAQRPDKVLSTLLLRYPRFIHAEVMTHRQFSRNAASSRAIPTKKLIQDVMDNPAMPIFWGKNQPGMQAKEELSDSEREMAQYIWESAMNDAVDRAQALANLGAHKQIVNRILEPFAHITVLVSATEWSNFLALRDHEDAEPHIRLLAQEVRRELVREDNIQILQPGEWHLPFTEDYDNEFGEIIKLSTARCASTSYKTVDGFDMTLERAIEIHNKLLANTPIHASPAEHVAQADEWEFNPLPGSHWKRSDQHGNFIGFRQYRKMLPNECL